MEHKKSNIGDNISTSQDNKLKKPDSHKHYSYKDDTPRNDLWTDGLICAFEFIRKKPTRTGSKISSKQQVDGGDSKMHVLANEQAEAPLPRLDRNKLTELSPSDGFRSNETLSFVDYQYSQFHQSNPPHGMERLQDSYWVPIGWARISELVRTVQGDADFTLQQFESVVPEGDLTVADLAAPYWERPAGPIWWCHVLAGHPSVQAWLSNAQLLHPAVSLALRDESRLISERMKHLLYEVVFFCKCLKFAILIV